MWPYSWTHVGTPSHLGHMDRVAATVLSQAHAGAAQEAPDIGQWEGQDVPLVRPSSCIVKGGIPSSRRYLPTYLGKIGEDVQDVPMVVDAEADMASLRRLASRPLHEALGTGLASQVYAIWHGVEMNKVPLVIHLVKQESHRAGQGNHVADGAAQAVDKEQEPDWRVPEGEEHLHLVDIPRRVGDEERARWLVEEDRGRRELRVYLQSVHMPAQIRGGRKW